MFSAVYKCSASWLRLLATQDLPCARLGVNDFYFQTSNRAGSFDFLPSVRLFKMIRWELSSRMRRTRFLEGWYDPESEAFRLTVHLFDRFVTSVKDQGSLPVILVFPKASDLRQYRFDQTKVYSSLLAELDEKGYLYIDLMDVFTAEGSALAIDDLVPIHYSPHANRLVAHHIVRRMQEHFPQLSSRDPTKLGQPIERF